MKYQRVHLLLCHGTACVSAGSEKIDEAIKEELEKHGLEKEVRLVPTGCFGFCAMGPVMLVYPEGVMYCRVKPEDIGEIVCEHLLKGRIVERLLYKEPDGKDRVAELSNIEFFRHQRREVLHNCGQINPEDIGEYIARDGYFALAEVLTKKTPREVIDIITKSGLRGRGGGGFPTGRKWSYAGHATGEIKYVICNGDEGDPGAFMDRSIMEGDPHAILEGLAIAGYAIGSAQGYIYVRAEYPIAVQRLEHAIGEARKTGLLGKDIFGSGFDFDIELRLGAGAFVCGEETALLHSLAGRRGEPRPRPPFPAVDGLFHRPTLINNVETLANVPRIILKGAPWFAGIGTEKSKGTKVFALAGKINNTGLIEVPMGTSLRTIIYDIGGGIPKGREFKAAQIGGPSGGCLPKEYLDTSLDYESLIELGAMMGSGGLIVMDESDCMVDIARFFLEFTQDESCGKCTPCRVGTKRMLEILQRITQGEGEEGDIELLKSLAEDIKGSSLCGLGQTAPNPVLSTLRFFEDEYIAHIRDKRCPAGVCSSLLRFEIIPEKCTACTVCARVCPVEAISGTPRKPPFVIHQDICIKCGACQAKCPFGAIAKV